MNPLWANYSKNPGVTREEVEQWQALNGAKLPTPVAILLREHNGGTIGRYCEDTELQKLEEIELVTEGPGSSISWLVSWVKLHRQRRAVETTKVGGPMRSPG